MARSKRDQKRVELKTLKEECLWFDDDCPECKEKQAAGGLCRHHANRVYYEAGKLSKTKAARFMANLRKMGVMLYRYEKNRIKRKNSTFAKANGD